MTIGNNIKELRKAAGITQKELAEICGLATGTIQQYELGKREPRQEKLEKIAIALNTSVSALVLQGLEPSPRTRELAKNLLSFTREVDGKEDKKALKERIDENFDKMNNIGRQKLADYSDDIVEKYQKKDE